MLASKSFFLELAVILINWAGVFFGRVSSNFKTRHLEEK